jgi:hypothetical protein
VAETIVMANRSYLCCSDLNRTYPSFRNPAFDAKVNILANGPYCVPMLWLCLFSEHDLRKDRLFVDGKHYEEPAPVTTREEALAYLPEAVPRLEAGLGLPKGSLREHGDCMAEMVGTAAGKYVALDLAEIAYTNYPDAFYDKLTQALRFLGGMPVNRPLEALLLESDFDVGRRIYPPRSIEKVSGLSEEDWRNFNCLLGQGYIRPVPWELPVSSGHE